MYKIIDISFLGDKDSKEEFTGLTLAKEDCQVSLVLPEFMEGSR
jgi:hypothetical protein